LIEADADAIETDVARMQDAMREASELVLPGFPLRSEAKIVRHPDRYTDPRGERFWTMVGGLLDEATCGAGATNRLESNNPFVAPALQVRCAGAYPVHSLLSSDSR